ncbi:metallophosphoesterase family protein [Radiobacillus deserti]|uniref:DNA repair exonuclease n=1 Tax=Radiobacillus deserti TaxID=2594883 RepID=A0A516KE78_9BACI|nr:DNA repair exonuclease [Radiobacillus deserti]QDP39713.1 DNA repair exonuclease [Radiobacillus deserti]
MTKGTIKFIHCADLHLDSPFKGLSNMSPKKYNDVQASTFTALSRLVRLAINEQVDFVLIVGDIFDKELLSLKAQIKFKEAMEQLHRQHIPVFASFGNHDYVGQRSLAVTLPENVKLFESEEVSHYPFIKDGKRLAHIYGFSYKEREVRTNKSSEYVRMEGAPFHIATLHGSFSTNKEHDVYAPFQISDLDSKPFDYWALGHIHKRDVLKTDPFIVYPGNIQGRSKKETGEKGCYVVEMDESTTELSFFPLQDIRFETLELDIRHCMNIGDVAAVLHQNIQHYKGGKYILTIQFLGLSSNLRNWHVTGQVADIMELENERDDFSMEEWIHIEGYKLSYYQDPSDQSEEQLGFRKEVFRSLQEEVQIQEIIQPLVQHKQVRKYLDAFTEAEQEELKEATKELIMEQLTKEG